MAVSADVDLLAETSSAGEEVLSLRPELPAKSTVRPDYLNQTRTPLPGTGEVTSTPERHRQG